MFQSIRWKLGYGLVIGALFFAAQVSGEEAAKPDTQVANQSYAIGVDIGRDLRAQGIEIDAERLAQGLKDALSAAQMSLTEAEMKQALDVLRLEMQRKFMEEMAKTAAENQKAGDAFLAENGKNEGVITLPSGLQYKIVTAGKGKKPTDKDTVVCRYKGTFPDGREFDNSERGGGTVEFQVGGVIPGWTEALKLMPVGSKWQLFIPAKLGYGEEGNGRVIGPNQILLFDLELVSIKK